MININKNETQQQEQNFETQTTRTIKFSIRNYSILFAIISISSTIVFFAEANYLNYYLNSFELLAIIATLISAIIISMIKIQYHTQKFNMDYWEII